MNKNWIVRAGKLTKYGTERKINMIMRFTYVTGKIEEVDDFYTALHHLLCYDVVEIHVIAPKTGKSKIFSITE